MSVSNRETAETLEKTASLLELQQANPFRVRSYRAAADRVRGMEQPIEELYRQKGETGLRELEGVGTKLASSLREIVETGRLGLRDRLEGEVSPESLFMRVPGIGEELAQRIYDELGIHSLEELEQAAHNGRLSRVEGIGDQKLKGIQTSLSGMLSRSSARRARQRVQDQAEPTEPPVSLILEMDREYRRKAEQDQLRRIAPRRFNPANKAWLPIMKQDRDDWQFALLFSNTKRAHDLGKTRDWVVVYYATDSVEDQCTVTTSSQGDLKGKRVVRGREKECREYYRRHSSEK